MAAKNRVTLKTYFETGDKPTESQFIDLIDSFFSLTDPDINTLSLKGSPVNEDVILIGDSANSFANKKISIGSLPGGGGGDFSDGGDAGGADRTLGNTDNYSLGFITNNLNRFHIKKDGLIGIGTTSPVVALDISGRLRFLGVNSATPNTGLGMELFYSTGASQALLIAVDRDSANDDLKTVRFVGDFIRFDTGASLAVDAERMRITDTGVGIGTASPDASAILDLTSTTGALLIPRMTTTQKNALTAVNGMIVYDSTLNKFHGYENGSWTALI